ncbi:TonB C-terminal domain-containing protein [Oricola sp.]|uniref:TonB C-terminal domain-containing protein n=1 Tax=Oricola sp. TaxID=1979950 RepID=UPI0025F681A6|nr:TonB C-terminal domain-containing protein [Oricola sp.]MCI5074605.1 TonB C-terminal domain-containing protein [Oricola sp.]
MRVGLVTSGLLHAVLLTWGMLSLSAPESFDVQDVEALPVELVSLAELTQVQKGAEDARKDGPSAPVPTEKPPVDKDAVNVGDKERDQAAPETETQKPVEVEQTLLPKPSEAPRPEPDRPLEPVLDTQPEPKPEPTTEMAALPEPRQPVEPDPVKEVIETAEPLPEEPQSRIPDSVPVPAERPERPPAQTARTDSRQETREREQAQAAPRAPDNPSKEDEVAALLNQEQASGGGAQRTRQEASFGGRQNTGGSELTQSEMDALRAQIQACWSPPAALDAGDLKVSIRFKLDRSGMVDGRPTVTKTSGNRAADESARRAILICGQRGYKLPPEKYDAWQDVVVNFDPSVMFR